MRLLGAHLLPAALFMMSLCAPCAAPAAQSPANPPPAASSAAETPSAIMQPSLDSLKQLLDVLRPEKWKTSKSAREEAAANITSIRRDLATTLPPLLATADSAPDSVAHVLPAYRNIEALYDVLLRVTETGNLAAPGEQAITLQRTLADLETGRRALGDRVQAAALARDQQLQDLQASVRAAKSVPAPAPPVCPPPPRTKKRRARTKTTRKPAPAPTASQTGTPSH